MRNMQYVVMVFILFFRTIMYCQQDSIHLSYTKTFIDKDFDISKVYYKGTHTKVSEELFNKLIKDNPNLHLKREIDDAGNVIRYWYDPINQITNTNPVLRTDVSSKNNFPNFKLTTLSNEEIELSKLSGKIVILRFELFANDFRFKKHEIHELDQKIEALEDKDMVKAIIIFQCSKSEVKEGFDLKDSNFELVVDGQSFIDKYGISRFPSTLVIDQKGNLINVFHDSEDIDIESYIKS